MLEFINYKKASRIITGSKYNAHNKPLFKTANTLRTVLNYNNLNSYTNCKTTYYPHILLPSHYHNNVKHTTTIQGMNIKIESDMTLRQNVYIVIYHMY